MKVKPGRFALQMNVKRVINELGVGRPIQNRER